jgi:crotonobetainyl-CoA:carnitine CoA-transferase CaiB-like acyl-CoA transferase
MLLGDQGADVVKIEHVVGGDTVRHVGPGAEGFSTYFANLNRSKRSLALDLGQTEAKKIVDELIDGADVVIHNFRASVATKLGLDAKTVRKGRPQLVYVAIGGFGAGGPYGGKPAYDHVIQALSGFAARQADPVTNEPSLVRQGVIDKATGLTAAQAITAALLQRERTGEGQEIEIHMLDVAVSFLWPDGMMNYTMLGPVSKQAPDISKSFRLTKTSDGHIAFALVHDRQWAKLAEAVGVASKDGSAPPSRPDVLRQVGKTLLNLATKDAVSFLEDQDIPVAEVVALDELAEHPQIVANDVIDIVDHPVLGRLRQPNPPARFGGKRAGDMLPAPALGQHDREILDELGYESDLIGQLLRDGVVGSRSALQEAEGEHSA